jgi:hypothetical protein
VWFEIAALLSVVFFAPKLPAFPAVGAYRLSDEERAEIASTSARHLAAVKRSSRLQTNAPSGLEDFRPRQFRNGGDVIRLVDFFRGYAQLILWCSLGIIGAAVLWNLKNNLWSASRSRKLAFRREDEVPSVSAAERMENAQAEADDLARSGSFSEAIHALLLRSVNEMKNRVNSPIAASLTSREILRHVDLSPEERSVFATIVDSVEVSYFGTHQPGGDEYAVCRRSFDALTDLLKRGRQE